MINLADLEKKINSELTTKIKFSGIKHDQLYLEIDCDDLNKIVNIINPRFQTLTYYGFRKEYLIDFIRKNNLLGIDRIVPIGRTSEFSLVWDGYDLVRKLSRICEIIW